MKNLICLISLFVAGFAQSQNVGIGVTAPQSKLHLFTGSSGTIPVSFADMTIESNRSNYISFLAPNNAETGILFGNPSHSYGGGIIYNSLYALQGLEFRVQNNAAKMFLTAEGTLRFNNLGSLIDLYHLNDDQRYGFGVISGALRMYTATGNDDIAFGNGNAIVFNEKFRMTGTGNFGIGVTAPTNALSFAGITEKKISLFPGATGDVGFAVGPSLLKIYSDYNNADIAFGYDDYDEGFTERMRIKGNGNVGIGIDPAIGKLVIHSGSSDPQVVVSQSGNADYSRINFKNANSGPTTRSWDIAAFTDAGTVANDRMNFFLSGTGNILSLTGNGNVGIGTTSPAHKLQVEGTTLINGNLGISNSNPTAPLTFAAALGKKITLYPGGSGDAGFGMSGNRLQIYADNADADVAIGYDAAGTFIERLAVKANGAISVDGYTGYNGAVLQSTGNTTPPVWASPTSGIYNAANMFTGSGGAIPVAAPMSVDIPGLIQTYATGSGLKTLVSFNVEVNALFCPGCFPSQIFIEIAVNNGTVKTFPFSIPNSGLASCSGTYLISFQTNTTAQVKIRLIYAGGAPGIVITPTNSNMVVLALSN